MKKIILFLLSVFIITGCATDYQVTITSDKKFVEEINIVLDRKTYSPDKSQAERDIDAEIANYQLLSEYRLYDIKYNVYNDRIEVKIVGFHKDFSSYKNSPFLNQMTSNVAVFEDEHYQIFTYDELHNLNRGVSADSKYYIKDFQVAVRAHNKISSSNAHEENTRKNTLIWYPLQEAPDEIKIDLEYGKRYDIIVIDFMAKYYLYIIVSGTLLLLGTVFFVGHLINYRMKNKI